MATSYLQHSLYRSIIAGVVVVPTSIFGSKGHISQVFGQQARLPRLNQADSSSRTLVTSDSKSARIGSIASREEKLVHSRRIAVEVDDTAVAMGILAVCSMDFSLSLRMALTQACRE